MHKEEALQSALSWSRSLHQGLDRLTEFSHVIMDLDETGSHRAVMSEQRDIIAAEADRVVYSCPLAGRLKNYIKASKYEQGVFHVVDGAFDGSAHDHVVYLLAHTGWTLERYRRGRRGDTIGELLNHPSRAQESWRTLFGRIAKDDKRVKALRCRLAWEVCLLPNLPENKTKNLQRLLRGPSHRRQTCIANGKRGGEIRAAEAAEKRGQAVEYIRANFMKLKKRYLRDQVKNKFGYGKSSFYELWDEAGVDIHVPLAG